MEKNTVRIPVWVTIVLVIFLHVIRALLILLLSSLLLMNQELLYGPTGLDPIFIGQIIYGLIDIFPAFLLLTKKHFARHYSALMAIITLSITLWIFATNTISLFYFLPFLFVLLVMLFFAIIEVFVLTSNRVRTDFHPHFLFEIKIELETGAMI